MVKKTILVVILICVIGRIVISFPLDNIHMLGGSDFTAHLFNMWYSSNFGITNWNKYLYAGYPSFGTYSPLSYLVGGYVGRIIGVLLAYKLIIDIFFIITPLVFYLFLKELKLLDESIAIALIIFSLMPVYFYYFLKGTYPTIINTVFILVFWILLKKTIDEKKLKYLVLASILLAISILTHHLTTLIAMLITFVWLVSYSFKIKSIISFFKICVLAGLISSWWLFPFIIEMTTKSSSESSQALELQVVPQLESEIISRNFVYALFGYIGIICIFSIFLLKDKNVKNFFITSVFLAILLILFPYKRTYLFVPIATSVLVGEIISRTKREVKLLVVIGLVVLLSLNYLSIKRLIYPYPEVPEIPKDGRVIYLPYGSEFNEAENEDKSLYSIALAPMKGNENIFGNLPQSQTVEKNAYTELLMNPLSLDKKEYYNLLKNGWVNYIVINNRYPNLVKYFNESENFILINETKLFFIFQLQPKSAYVEINGKPLSDVDVVKDDDKILINFTCSPGELAIKESYHNYWNGFIDKKKIVLGSTKYGFMKTNINETNKCMMLLQFTNPWYYMIFDLISIASVGFALIVFFKKP